MRLWSLLNARNPLWRMAGWGLLGATLAGTAILALRGPRALRPVDGRDLFASGPMGTLGTVTEQLGQGRFVLSYAHILGSESDLRLQGVKGRLYEPEETWNLEAPSARRREGLWLLDGPLDVQAYAADGQRSIGQGRIQQAGPALSWDHGVWRGLAPLVWQDRGIQTAGVWTLPAGWERSLDGRFQVRQGPVRWEALEPGTIRRIEAARLWANLGLQDGRLEEVRADLEGGSLEAGVALVEPGALRWKAPITFRRADGWVGQAQEGTAPRPEEGKPLERVELRAVRASRGTPSGAERLQAEGARWTPAGLRLEGDVHWEQPLEGQRLSLRAARLLFREQAGGGDLPPDLPVGVARAEAAPVLSWAGRSLSGARMEARRDRQWLIRGPVYGRSEQGTFRAGTGQGNPKHWAFEGPVQAHLLGGAIVEGDRLVWEDELWTFQGRPVTWTRLRERLTGPKVQKRGELVTFPEGIAGSLAAPDGNMSLRADRAEGQKGVLLLSGRVECQGAGWRLQAERISVTLGPDHQVRSVGAKGNVVLRGEMGEGRGETLELDVATRRAVWKGRVRGLAEVAP